LVPSSSPPSVLHARRLAIRAKLEPILFPAPRPLPSIVKSLFSSNKSRRKQTSAGFDNGR
jgi:hypothetical protein